MKQENNLIFDESHYIERFKKLFGDCSSEEDYKARTKQIYKGKNPETMSEEERQFYILSYLYPEKSERQIKREVFEICESERKLFESIENFSESIDKIDIPELNFDIPELNFKDEDFDFIPELELDSTEIDKALEKIKDFQLYEE